MITNYESGIVWVGILFIFILSMLLLVGNVIRRKVPIFRKSLLPTAVISGILGLLLKEFVARPLAINGLVFTAQEILDFNKFLNVITYHALALGFIAMGLKVNEKIEIKTSKSHGYYNGLLIVATYILQGIVGIGLTFIMAYTLFPAFKSGPGLATGILLPFGFGQGPGQANNFGIIYEQQGFIGGQSYGLAIASMGFIWAAIGGVLYLNKKHKKSAIEQEHLKLTSVQEIETPDEIPVAESIDKFTIQISLVLMVYGATLFTMFGVSRLAMLIPGLGDTLNSLVWGFNFIFGMVLAIIFKKLFKVFRKTGLMTRQYPNNFMLNRISGIVFDFMVVASITAINISDLKDKWIPFLIITMIGGIMTMIYLHILTKRIYKEYPIEAFAGMFGMMTGTASTGVALLREVDPNFKTPAATDLVTGTTTAVLFGLPILLIAGFAPGSIMNAFISLIALVVLFLLFTFLLLKAHPKVVKR
ncbi:MAG TPA: hypothetical protein VJY66_03950 [Acholeplasma sp.]|nr:hypothetical protein [Acholeplasma sp.]